MFRLIAFVCLIHICVGNIIRGRILLDGDANQADSISTDSQLFIQLEQISEADSSRMIFVNIEISNLVAFPIEYQVRIPSNTPSTSSYKLSAQIKKRDMFLYVGEETIPATIGSDAPVTVDIPVRVVRGRRAVKPWLNDVEQLSWPELVGRKGTYAVKYIKEKTGLTNVVTVPDGSAVTMDYRTDRVRIFVNKKGIVVRTPLIG